MLLQLTEVALAKYISPHSYYTGGHQGIVACPSIWLLNYDIDMKC